MTEAGLGDRIVLGMDAARQGYYRAYGGSPGLTYLLDGFSRAMSERGLGLDVWRAVFIDNPARAFAFAAPSGTTGASAPAASSSAPPPATIGRRA